jgi:hypothetical protein
MNASLLKRPTAILPIAMSLAALALVIGYAAIVGVSHHKDEGAPARVFELLLVAQLPIIAMFAVKWLPRAPKQALLVLSIQALAAIVAVGTVLLLEGRS